MPDDANGRIEPNFGSFAAFAEARRAQAPVRRAAIFFVILAIASAAALLLPASLRASPVLQSLRASGMAAPVIVVLVLGATGLLATSAMVRARRRLATPQPQAASRARLARWLRCRRADGRIARGSQAIIVTAGVVIAAGVALALWPVMAMPELPAQAWLMMGGGALLLAFPLLVIERVFAGTDARLLPEAPALRSLLLLPVAACVVAAAVAFATGFGFARTLWLREAALVFPIAVAAELALRALGSCFLPAAEPERARAPIGSWLAAALHPANASPAALAATMRDKFGVDFARSWALVFVRRALPPVLLFMLVVGWTLTGLTEIGTDQRGSYELAGAPLAMLKPGIHVVPPWPFGRVRRVEYGVVHAVEVSYGSADPTKAAMVDNSRAEDPAPASANRLWDQALDSDVSYIIASETGGHQSFETVSVNVRVLYRVGLTDASAREALYQSVAPEDLVRSASGRLLAHFFAQRTLNDALGENRESIANGLRVDLQRDLDQLASGLEVVGVVIEAMHPPGGAAVAYRAVQAAEIAAQTSIAEERGRAATTKSLALRDANTAIADADANAATTVSAAAIDLSTMTADTKAYQAGGQAFLLERYFADLKGALGDTSLEIIDHRLAGGAPTIDLRPPGSANLAGSGDQPR